MSILNVDGNATQAIADRSAACLHAWSADEGPVNAYRVLVTKLRGRGPCEESRALHTG